VTNRFSATFWGRFVNNFSTVLKAFLLPKNELSSLEIMEASKLSVQAPFHIKDFFRLGLKTVKEKK